MKETTARSGSVLAASLRGVTMAFGDTLAVDHVDIDIPQGQLTTLLGPSGCGKTTTLRMLAGYLAPTDGTITISGREATRLPPEKRNLGMVFQSYALFPHMTVADNVAYGLKLRKLPAPDLSNRVGESLQLVGLEHLADRKPKQLSGGQQQRVALARAIAIRPDILLLDEPLSNLDARLRVQMRSELRRIKDETGLTVVLVTHDQEEALEMSDLMVLMCDGRVVQSGSPSEVFSHPCNRFVADFLGYENFFAFTATTLATVRPEHMTFVADRPNQRPDEGQRDQQNVVLPAVIDQIAYRGVDLVVRATATDASDDLVPLVAELRPETAGGFDLHPGDRAMAIIPLDRLVSLADGH